MTTPTRSGPNLSAACGAWELARGESPVPIHAHQHCTGRVALPAPRDVCECTCHDVEPEPAPPSWWVEEYAPFYGMTERELHEAGRCAELVPVMTEDGPSDGRCMAPVADDELAACEGHASERRQWMAMPELERGAWERRQDDEAGW